MKIPGIKSVYCPPEGSGRFLAIISMQQMYPGHADQVLTAVHLHRDGRVRTQDRASWSTRTSTPGTSPA